MLRRLIVVFGCAALLAAAGPAQAAAAQGDPRGSVQATLVLKSGERISGGLVDLGGVGFTIIVNGQDRQIQKADVAVIEFANPGNQTAMTEVNDQLGRGKHVAVLRGGETITGNLIDIGGRQPKNFMFDTAGGRRDVRSTDIARIYLAQSSGSVATSGSTAGGPSAGAPGTISVPGTQQWVATGITVRRGERIGFNVQGEITLSPDQNDKAGSAGALSQRRAGGAPLPNEFAGALIARIGNGEPFAIGNNPVVTMPESGPLYLGVNDDNTSDNGGQFTVTLNRAGINRRR